MQLWHFLKFSWKPFEEAFSKNRFQSSSLESGSMALSHIMSWPLPPPFLTQQPGEGWFRGEGFTTAKTQCCLSHLEQEASPVAAYDLEMPMLLPEKQRDFCYLLLEQVKPSMCGQPWSSCHTLFHLVISIALWAMKRCPLGVQVHTWNITNVEVPSRLNIIFLLMESES